MKNKIQDSTLEPLSPSTLEPLKEGWRWVRLGEVCKVSSGSSAPQEQKYFENGKYPSKNGGGGKTSFRH